MYKKRIRILAGIIITLLFLLVVRLGYIQLIEGTKYSGISNKRRIKRTPIEALRGKIFDRNGLVLATNKHSFNVSVKYNDFLYYYLRQKKQLLPRLSKIKAHKKKTESCTGCHNEQENTFRNLLGLLDIDRHRLFDIAEKTVKRVEKIKESVSKRMGKEIRIVEETRLHPVAQNVPFKVIAKIESRKSDFPGIFVEIEPYRWYPYNQLAAHLIGYTDKIKESGWARYGFKENYTDNWPLIMNCNSETYEKRTTLSFCDDIIDKSWSVDRLFELGYLGHVRAGRTGVEAYYNMALLGRQGERFEEITYENAKPNKIIIERPANSGDNIFLTINSNIQFVAEKALGNIRGAVIVMNPWNGEIIAMAGSPRFDLNTFNKDFHNIINDKRKPLLNRPIQSTLPPGSTIKVVTAIAALTENVITRQTMFKCTGRAGSDTNKFRCASKWGHGMISIEEALQRSCNEFFFQTAKELGGNLLHKWCNKFGFGQRSGIDVPYERKGLLPNPKSIWETMNTSIGQGDMLATPIQVTKMMAIVANGGYVVRPHVLKKITKYSGNVAGEVNIDKNKNLKIPANVMEIIKRALVRVVTDGTARSMGIDKYRVAGKTGTAETRNTKDNHAWFTGYAPHDDPEYCFTVLIEHTPMHAAEATGPVLRKLLAGLFPEKSS
ncbi:MAG: peptidoglycan D,D-transpeptidase FtsI family protein [Candidatus Anammoxibacter sp.]